MILTIDLKEDNCSYDIYISHENSSGAKYIIDKDPRFNKLDAITNALREYYSNYGFPE